MSHQILFLKCQQRNSLTLITLCFVIYTIATKINKPIAFEIPLDEDLKASRGAELGMNNAPMKVSLPKLALSDNDIMAKLANSEARWKVLYSKPFLSSSRSVYLPLYGANFSKSMT
jgi:hypothetical protein